MGLQQASSWFRRQAAPITIGIIASQVVIALFWWFTALKGMESIVLGPGWQQKLWTLLTYPWATMPFASGLALVCFVFLCMWVFWTGGTIERDLGPAKYIGLWTAMILLPALFISLLGPVVGSLYGAAGLWLPEAGITIVWCTRNPTAQIMMYGIIPLSGKWLGWVTVATTILLAGFGNPLLGVVCALHLPVAFAFASNRIPAFTYNRGASTSFAKAKMGDRANLKKSEKMDPKYYDEVKKREKEREERERLRKLFESSIQDDSTGTDR
ncbi:MAG: hypothetical protein IT203_12820 [Fimbriimonadaceae bacterium]|nr:hypothetical protein [Fimbriimonadaceae bacterium]